jgi:hypothetical protein
MDYTFFHRMMYYKEHESCSIVKEHDHNLVNIYHPLSEKYGVHLVLQTHVIHMREHIHSNIIVIEQLVQW